MKGWKSAGYPVVKTDPLPAYRIDTIDSSTFKKEFGSYCIVDIRTRKRYAMGLRFHLNTAKSTSTKFLCRT